MSRDKTVLVVDDEPSVRSFLALVLEDEGYRVETASDGCEALAKARTVSLDAVVLDLLMPVLDGVGFLREWRTDPARGSVPILLISVEAPSVQADSLGAQGVLLKPFDLDTLLSKLASVL